MSPEPPQPLQHALTDRYRLERELGQGGMATVYLAEDLKHHRKVAVKVLRPDLAASLAEGGFSARSRSRRSSNTPTFFPSSIPAKPRAVKQRMAQLAGEPRN